MYSYIVTHCVVDHVHLCVRLRWIIVTLYIMLTLLRYFIMEEGSNQTKDRLPGDNYGRAWYSDIQVGVSKHEVLWIWGLFTGQAVSHAPTHPTGVYVWWAGAGMVVWKLPFRSDTLSVEGISYAMHSCGFSATVPSNLFTVLSQWALEEAKSWVTCRFASYLHCIVSFLCEVRVNKNIYIL